MWPLGFAAWLVQEIRQWPPFCFGCIILTSDGNRFINNGEVSDRNSPSSWVTINLGIGSYLLNLRQSKSSLFLQFPDGSLFRCLVHIHKTARECPASLEWLIASLDKQHLWFCLLRYYNTVSRHCRSWIFVSIWHSLVTFRPIKRPTAIIVDAVSPSLECAASALTCKSVRDPCNSWW